MKIIHSLIFILLTHAIFTQELTTGFGDIKLGSSMETVKNQLVSSGYFNYRGDPDVSLLLTEEQSIIESKGYGFVDNAYFQFNADELYTISLILNNEYIDYSSIFKRLTEKYGKHTELSPEQVFWELDDSIITLEKPITVKYINKNILNRLKESSETLESINYSLREDFLDEL